MTIDELVEAMRALVDAAEGRDLTDEEAERYEQYEADLAVARRSAEIRSRQSAYETPVRNDLNVNVGVATQDDGLERAFEHYLRTGTANQDIAELRAQSVGTDSQGGYMVPPGFRQKLVEVQKAFGGLAAEVESFSTESGATLEYPTLNDTANSGSITAENTQFAAGADLVFGTVNLGAFKYTSQGTGTDPLRVSVELLQDAAFDVQGLVSRALGTRIARAQAVDWAVGVGTTEPLGILNGAATTVNLAATNVITYADLLDIEAALDPAYEQNAQWVMNKATWMAVKAIEDAQNRPLIFANAEAGIGGRPMKTLLGYPVVIDQAFNDVAGDDVNFAVLGDLRESYVIRRVAPLTVIVNPYSRANFGQVEYVAWERADGTAQNTASYVIAATQDVP